MDNKNGDFDELAIFAVIDRNTTPACIFPTFAGPSLSGRIDAEACAGRRSIKLSASRQGAFQAVSRFPGHQTAPLRGRKGAPPIIAPVNDLDTSDAGRIDDARTRGVKCGCSITRTRCVRRSLPAA